MGPTIIDGERYRGEGTWRRFDRVDVVFDVLFRFFYIDVCQDS